METSRKHLLMTSRIPVRWGDMDAYGHVNNTVYFRYFEQIRVEWLESVGSRVHIGEEVGPIIVNADCTFRLPVSYPATVEIRMYGGDPGRSSLMTWYELYVVGDERLYAEGSAKTVWVNHRLGRATAVPEHIRALFG